MKLTFGWSQAVYGESQSAEVLVLFLSHGQMLSEDFAPLSVAVEKIMLIESLGRHKDFLGNDCLQPSWNCVEML